MHQIQPTYGQLHTVYIQGLVYELLGNRIKHGNIKSENGNSITKLSVPESDFIPILTTFLDDAACHKIIE
jgi:hypothetical protein